MIRLATISIFFAAPCFADAVYAARNLPAQTILSLEDVTLNGPDVPNALASVERAVGLETNKVIYAGRPIYARDLSHAAVIDRNQMVRLLYVTDSLTIQVEGRALDRAAEGDSVRVMNLSSKSIVSGIADETGAVYVRKN